MIVKSCKFGTSKCNREDSFTSSCWVPWGTPLQRFKSLEAGSGRSCCLSLFPSHLLGFDVLPLLPQGVMFCCQICSEGQQVSWPVLFFLSFFSLACADSWSPVQPFSCHTVPWLPWSSEPQRRRAMTWAEFLWTIEICRWIKISVHLGRLILARISPKVNIKESVKNRHNKTNTKRCEVRMVGFLSKP